VSRFANSAWLAGRLSSRRRELPGYRVIRIGLVGTEGSGPDASREDISQLSLVLRDSIQYRLDGLADALPGAFGSRHRPPIASTESDGARELPGQCIDLRFRLLGALDVAQLLGFFQFLTQLRKPVPVRGLGLIVEHLAGITQTADMDPRPFEILIPARQAMSRVTGFVLALAADSTRQVKHVEFSSRMAQQMGEIGKPLGVLEAKGFPSVPNGPVLALFPENPFW
jgi:hypothetical protein